MSQNYIGYGITLHRGDGASPEQFVKIAQVMELTPPAMTKDSVEVTHTDSPDGFREFIPGLKDGGEFSATVNFLPAEATHGDTAGGMMHDFLNETQARNYQIRYPGSPEVRWTFAAFISNYETAAPMDDRITITVTFKVAGKPVIDE